MRCGFKAIGFNSRVAEPSGFNSRKGSLFQTAIYYPYSKPRGYRSRRCVAHENYCFLYWN